MPSMQFKYGKWDIELGVNIDGELVIYTEHESGEKVHVHKLGEGSYTREIEDASSGALFYIDGDMT